MKRTAVVLVSTLVVSFALYAQSGKGASAAKQGKANSAVDAESLVKARYDAFKNKDARLFGSMVTDDLVTVGAGGTSDKAGALSDMKACTLNNYSLSDFKQIQADPNVLVLTFRSKEDGSCGGEKAPENVVVSEVLVKRGGKWLCLYHHETVAEKT